MSAQELVSCTVDGRTVQVPKGTLLIEACKAAVQEVPYFCYHPKLDPAGVCRMCLVQVEKMPKPVTACTTVVADGMVVHTQSPLVKELQIGVLEFLLVNHPLDCPVCDKGGECDLQDLTFKYGPSTSRLADAKIRKDKAVDLGPFIVLDRERCILCRRCTRFDNEIAGEGNLIVAERGHETIVTTLEGQPFDSYFGGNTIELCPVGALTSDLYRFKARPWDLAQVPGICSSCSVGCNVRWDFRHGRLLRVITRDNPETDNGWICDRGRFNYNYVQGDERLRQPMIRKGGQLVPATWTEALALVVEQFKAASGRAAKGGGIGVIGGGRLTVEEAYLLQKLARAALGTPHVDHRVSGQVTSSVAGLTGRITDLDTATAILVVDLLPAERAPVLDLRVRRALERRGVPLLAVGAAIPRYRRRIEAVQVPPDQTAAVLAAAASEVGRRLGAKPAAAGEPARRLGPKAAPAGSGAGVAAAATNQHSAAATRLADLLLGSQKTVVLWGGADAAVGRALVNLLQAAGNAKEGRTLHLLVPGEQANSRGAAWAGALPGYLPGFQAASVDSSRQIYERAWQAKVPAQVGLDTEGMLQAAADGQLSALYLVGANLTATFPDGRLVDGALAQVPFLVVQDLFLTETARAADVVLPVAASQAKAGSYAALDGLVQRVAQPGMAEDFRSDAQIFAALASALGYNLKATDREVGLELGQLAGGLVDGQVLPAAPLELLGRADSGSSQAPAPAATGAMAGGAVAADASVQLILVPVERLYAGGGTAHHDPGLRRMTPAAEALLHPTDLQRLALRSGDRVRLSYEDAELQLIARCDRRVLAGTVQVVRGLPAAPVNRLLVRDSISRVTVQRLVPAEVR